MKSEDLFKPTDLSLLTVIKITLICAGLGAALTLANEIIGWALAIQCILLIAVEIAGRVGIVGN